MPLPANVRVNTQANFPTLITGSGPVVIGKTNGIWTIGLSVASLAPQIPPAANYPTDFLLVWDDVLKTYFRMSIADIIAATGIITGSARLQRLVTATPIVVLANDQIINCKIAAPAACTLPLAGSRAGVPLTFKDLGRAAANHITLTPAAGETIDGLGSVTLASNYQAVTLVPLNDGASIGWAMQ